MDTLRKIIKYSFVAVLSGWLLLIGLLKPISTMAGENTSSSTSSSSTNSGQNLYDALRAIYGDSSSGSSSSSSSSSCVTVEQLMKRMETEPIGPKVQDTSLSESYHDDYKVYEERLGEVYTIYTNVKNSGVTNKPVVIDVPRGVGTSLKQDGSDIPFVTKQPIEQEGAYVLELFVGEDEDTFASFSEQTFLKAKFRFRIQKSSGINGVVGEGDFEEEPPVEEEVPEETTQDDLMLEESTEEENPFEEEIPTAPEIPKNADILSAWDNALGYYINTLKTGETFYSNLPNGSFTNEPVLIQEATGLEYKAYKDGEEYEDFKAGEFVNVVGSYAIYILKPGDGEFLNAYPFGNPAFRFRIISGKVNDIGFITAPVGVTIRNVRYNGLDENEDLFLDDDTVHIDKNGDYEITFDDDSGSREVDFTLDTDQPVFSVDVKPNEAAVTYYSDDVSRCVLYKGDKVISDPEIVNSVTKAGKYTLVVYDAAGNAARSEFTVRYRINAAAVIAILAVLGIIAGVLVYLLRMKKNVKVV